MGYVCEDEITKGNGGMEGQMVKMEGKSKVGRKGKKK